MNFKKVSKVVGVVLITLFAFYNSIQAQCNVKFTASTINGKQNDEVKVLITTDNFTELSSFQWTHRFDPAVLEFKSINDLDLPDLTLSSFNTARANQGIITASWFFQSGATKPNGATIYSITFKIIGADGKTSAVEFSDTPLKREIADKNSQVCTNATTVNGRVNSGTVVNPPAGLTLKIAKVSGTKDQEVCVPVSVLGFSKITAMQFSFGWDTARLKYTKLQKFSGLTQFDSGNFGTNNVNRGQLSSVWIDQAVTGQTVPDNTVIFEICFRYTGACPGSADISITDVPTRTNFVGASGAVTVTKENGSVTASQCNVGISVAVGNVVQPCPGQNNGSITINVTGGSGTPTYTWTNGATTKDLTGLGAGTYNVTVRDGSGSSASLAAAIILAPLTVTAQSTNPTGGQNNGSVTLTVAGGNPNITYTWSNNATTKDINNLAAGTYTYTVKDGSNCTVTGSVTIGDVALDVTNIISASPNCNGSSTGSISVTVVGGKSPFTFSWTGPSNFTSTNEDITGLKAGTYKLTVRDANNATKATNDIVLQDPAAFSVNGTVNRPTQAGNDGSINITVTGGTAPYSYRWNDGSTQQNRTLLSPGNYSITATDSKGCTASKAFNVTGSTGATCFVGSRVMTPNNDGINEFLVINCADGAQLQVFNRYNQLVYSSDNYTNNWNGVSNSGTLVPDGTYYWIVRVNTGTANEIHKGFTALIRSLN